jgi:hypothetical protein
VQKGWRGSSVVVVVVSGCMWGPGGSCLGSLLSGISFVQRYQFLCRVWVVCRRTNEHKSNQIRKGVEWDLCGGGKKGGPGFGAGQERLGSSCSGHDILKARGLKNHAQTASGSSASLISMLF